MIDIKDFPDGKRAILSCDKITHYSSLCPECGRTTDTPLKKTLPECPICKSKKIGKPQPVKCGYSDKVQMADDARKQSGMSWQSYIEVMLKSVGAKHGKSGEYYCKDHTNG
jgi:DNA-directed RNA polymerase subunit RPC12/RpoP